MTQTKKAKRKAGVPSTKAPAWVEVTAGALEAARKRRSMSKAAWARYLGVGLSTYWNWVRGLNTPTRTRQRRLLAVLDAASGLALVGQRQADAVTGAEPARGGAETATFMTVRGLQAPEAVTAAAVQGVTAVMAAMAAAGKLDPKDAPGLATTLLAALLGRP